MHRNRLGGERSGIHHTAAPKLDRIGIENFLISALLRHADAVMLPHDRGKIDHRDQSAAPLVKARKGDDVLRAVVHHQPAESLP